VVYERGSGPELEYEGARPADWHLVLRTAAGQQGSPSGKGRGGNKPLSVGGDSARVCARPDILEFLGLPGTGKLLESTLEQALIEHLQAFLLELGKGFAFVARQQRISTESKDFYIDIVFYNYLLKCFVLFDLKTGELTHQDIGQMDMYVRIYDDQRRGPEDNPTVGIILCASKDETVVRYSMLHGNEKLFATKYKLVLPSEAELRAELAREQRMLLGAMTGNEITAPKRKRGVVHSRSPQMQKP
jgi:hypothetical protein